MKKINHTISFPGLTGACSLIWALLLVTPAWSQVSFSDVAVAAGVNSSYLGTDAAWGDYDNDGYLDLYVTNWGTALGVPYNHLYRNDGDGTFTNVGLTAGVASDRNSSSGAWGDYDNDGDLDLYVTNWVAQDLLYRNNGNGTFTNVTGSARLDINAEGRKMEAVWADFDLDGWLDLYLCKYYAANELYHNEQDGSFTQVAGLAGVDDVRDSDAGLWADFNDDAYPDLLVTNRDQDNSFYLNNGDGTFEEISDAIGLGALAVGKAAAVLDYDLDGRLDLLAVNIGSNRLYGNQGFPTGFSDVSLASGIKTAVSERIHFDAAVGDLDGDGDADVFLASGGESNNGEINRLLLNGAGLFADATAAQVTPPALEYSTAVAAGDFDNDFIPDIYVVNSGANRLYGGASSGAFLKVRVVGAAGSGGEVNVQGLGTRVYLYLANTVTLVGLVEIGSAGSAPEALIGLPAGNTYDVEVKFPSISGWTTVDKVTNPELGLGGIDPLGGSQLITVEE
ncbi:FG-GAP repeat domain-containing protein [candidate division KSB1 bacterium]